MSLIIGNNIVVPVDSNRKGNIAYCIYNISSAEYLSLSNDKADKNVINKLANKKGILFGYSKSTGLYAILRDKDGKAKPSLYWVSEKEIKYVEDEIAIVDNSSLINLDKFGIDTTKDKKRFANITILHYKNKSTSIWSATNRAKCVEELIGVSDTKKTFEITNGESTVTVEEKEEDTAEIEENFEEEESYTNEENIEQESSIDKEDNESPEQFDFLKKADANVLNMIKDSTNSMNNAINELNNITSKYRDALSKMNGELPNSEVEQLVRVEKIVDDEDNKDDYNEALYAIYGTILKLIKTNDTVSIPRVYYEHLCVNIHRNIYLSRNGEKYNSIVSIKTTPGVKENMLARVEYNKLEEYVRVTVIKEMNNFDVPESYIVNYEIQYNEWKKRNSFNIG